MSDPSLWEMEREIGWKKGEGRREAVDEMFLLCFTASDTDPSVKKSFTLACIQTLFRYGPLFISFLLYVFLPSICIALSCLQSHYRVWCTGQVMAAKQLLSWGSSGHIFFSFLVFCFLSFRPVLWNINNNVTTKSVLHKQKAFMCLLSFRHPTGPERTSAGKLSHLSVSPCHFPLDSL